MVAGSSPLDLCGCGALVSHRNGPWPPGRLADEFVNRRHDVEHRRQDEDAPDADPYAPGGSVAAAWRRRLDQPIARSHRLVRSEQAASGAALPPPQPYEDDRCHRREGGQLEVFTR